METGPLSILQLTFLAIIQGLTEFLPISSSAHLILPSEILGWPDQGLSFDVAVHFGTLLAVLLYLRQEWTILLRAWLMSVFRQQHSESSRLAWLIILATLPAMLAGLLMNDWVAQNGRSSLLIGITSIVFALLLWWADQKGRRQQSLTGLNWRQALFVGVAQALALLPGTSRSGITMTAALFCDLNRRDAARFSFLLAIPIIFGSALLRLSGLGEEELAVLDWPALLFGTVVSALTAFFCIHFFMRLIERTGFLPFVIYRVVLGIVLLGIYWVS